MKKKKMYIKIYKKNKRLCFLKIEVSAIKYNEILNDIKMQLLDDSNYVEIANMLIPKEEIDYVRY